MSLPATPRNVIAVAAVLLLLLGLTVLVSLTLGAVHLPLSQVWSVLVSPGTKSDAAVIVREIRLPRILFGHPGGGSAFGGRHGASSPAAQSARGPVRFGNLEWRGVGAIVALWVGGRIAAASPWAAFAGAVITMIWVYLLGKSGGRMASYTLILAGVVTALSCPPSFCSC